MRTVSAATEIQLREGRVRGQLRQKKREKVEMGREDKEKIIEK